MEKNNGRNNLLAILMALVLLVSSLPIFSVQSYAASDIAFRYPNYITAGHPESGISTWTNTTTPSAIEVTDSAVRVTWTTGWYVVNGDKTITGGVDISGDVHLILADGCKLTIDNVDNSKAGISVTSPSSLTIYGQSSGSGQLIVTGGSYSAGIGGNSNHNGNNITINGGILNIKGAENASGIGGGYDGGAKNIIINGGTINADGTDQGGAAGIGGGSPNTVGANAGTGEDIIINGGIVSAHGGHSAAGIGGGYGKCGQNITINGGTVSAISIGDGFGSGIGGGIYGDGYNITVAGGTVNAYGGAASAGIGGGFSGVGYNITIKAGTVTATGGYYGAGIGSGMYKSSHDIKIEGGTVNATGGYGADGIGNGSNVITSSSTITVADTLAVHIGHDAPEHNAITHDSSTDLSSNLAGFRYVSIQLASVPAPKVAEVGGTQYDSLQDAINSATSGSTIKLISETEENITIVGKSLILDLNGMILEGTGSGSVVTVNSGATLTIIDSSPSAIHYYAHSSDEPWEHDCDSTPSSHVCSPTGSNELCHEIIYGGAISGGNASVGGGINNSGILIISAGAIVGNKADKGAGIYNAPTAQLTIGCAVIKGNKTNGADSNLYLSSGSAVSVQGLAASSYIGISTENVPTSTNAVRFAVSASSAMQSLFKSDNSAYEVITSGSELWLKLKDQTTSNTNTVTGYYWSVDSSNQKTADIKQSISDSKHCPKDETCPLADFTDLDPKQWYHDGLHFCIEEGFIKGYAGEKLGLCGPDDDITRAQIVTILWRFAGSPKTNYTDAFNDVFENSWYAEAVCWGAANEVVKGYTDGSFAPDKAISREELAQILYCYAKKNGNGFENESSANFEISNPDAGDISKWAGEAMHWTVLNKITAGDSNKLLHPCNTATRAEAASMIQRFCNLDWK